MGTEFSVKQVNIEDTGLTLVEDNYGNYRMFEVNGELYAIGADFAHNLGYAAPRNAIKRHCKNAIQIKEFIKRTVSVPLEIVNALSKIHSQTMIIPEKDIHLLIINSKLPKAQAYADWVFGEVLPSIRKTGQYSLEQEAQKYFPKGVKGLLEDLKKSPLSIVKLVNNLSNEVMVIHGEKEALEAQIEQDKPDTEFGKKFKILNYNINPQQFCAYAKACGFKIGRTRLFKKLRNIGLLVDRKPTRRAKRRNLIIIQDGRLVITPAGQEYIINIL